MANAPFPIHPELTGVSIAYRNDELIADQVLPRKTVGKKEFKYFKWEIAEGFTIPDTKVGRRSQPNEVEFTGTEVTDSADDYGLEDPIPQDDIDNADSDRDPLAQATQSTTDLIMLDREQRTAGLVFNFNSYAAANRVTLAGTDQWSDYVDAASDPIADIKTGLDALLMRPNVMVLGQTTWSKLSSHPKIMTAVHGNEGPTGIARRQQIAELFELDAVLVGRGWVNTAKKGQPPVMARIWGKHCALLRIDSLASPQNGSRVTFGMTAQYKTRVAGAIPDSKIGLRGGQRLRVGETVKELITSVDAGYFIQNAVA